MEHTRVRRRPDSLGTPLRIAGRLALLLGLSGLARPAAAEPVAAVVEMYTSQGCAACRAADPIMRELAAQPGVLALTLPVTYWDYLGWKDTLALRGFNERQRAYAHARGARQVVTPQAVVNGGQAVIVGSNRPALDKALKDAGQAPPLPVTVSAQTQGPLIVIDVSGRAPDTATATATAKPKPAGKGEDKAEVWLVPLVRSRVTKVETGENGGRVANDVNIVRSLQRLGSWAGQPVHFEIPATGGVLDGADGYAVLVQYAREGRIGRILGAAKGPGL
ncbi:DUF1223 domain-containing protein [Methylobacterium aerolatum]|uniref:DUF1223 domain-containing protein n=1 Tax=Methylobacterium aerolatum TaxID=418708 RepID=A0ABU0HXC9_9HYPH|nr:DUF1223 domain-containing protein [Methylobacterium aerolatum]MDQ0446473.1 hypothetical protein [Methylobacterium aerolatum]GJD33364.1 hypothetical protein FMGBMHLM_0251 [Methylobacterium aerolatum]